MAFQKKTWVDRISEEPQRRKLTDVNSGTETLVDVTREEGTVTQEGDAFSAANMNDLESRIEGALGAGDVLIAGTEATSTASKAYTVGQYLIYNDKLYRVKTAIASGASLVVNTNIVETKAADEIANHLVANNKGFYFDYKNGKYGYNTSPSRGADTFFPFKSLPETGIYGSKAELASGYYSYAFKLYGWAQSTQLLLNVDRSGNLYLYNITSCKLDGVTQTISNNTWSPSTGTACDGTDHIITFTVQSGKLPQIYLNNSSGSVVTKAIFND